jgi:hypothetical protein
MENCVSTLRTCTVMCRVIAALFLYRCLTKCYSKIFHSQGENTSAIDCNWGNLAAEERRNCTSLANILPTEIKKMSTT